MSDKSKGARGPGAVKPPAKPVKTGTVAAKAGPASAKTAERAPASRAKAVPTEAPTAARTQSARKSEQPRRKNVGSVSVADAPTMPASQAEPAAAAVAPTASVAAAPGPIEKPVPVKGPEKPERAKTVPAAVAGPTTGKAQATAPQPAPNRQEAPADAGSKVVPLPSARPGAPAAPAALSVQDRAPRAPVTPVPSAGGMLAAGTEQTRAVLSQAQDAGEGVRRALLESTTATTRGLVELNAKLVHLVQVQNNAAFAAWRSTVTAGSLSEAIRAQTSGLRQVYEATASQWKDIAETTGRVMGEAVKPLQAAWTPKSR